jgi:uncharacterized tellurite resistance protein B-like protein
MEQLYFKKILLKTAFSCMACDGNIDKSELALIQQIEDKQQLFGIDDFTNEINALFNEINNTGKDFLRGYLKELGNHNFSVEQQIKIIEISIKMMKADGIEKYSEFKFFKILRSKLNISDDEIIQKLGVQFDNLESDYLSQDIISSRYLEILQNEYFSTFDISEFALLNSIDVNTILKNKND